MLVTYGHYKKSRKIKQWLRSCHSVTYSFNKYILHAYYLPSTILGNKDITMNKQASVLFSWELHSIGNKRMEHEDKQ